MIGIIYKVQTYQESNRLLFVYTEEGKFTLVAKGSERLSSSLRILSQYLNLIEFEKPTKKMQTLRDAKLVYDFKEIKEDYFKTKKVAVMLEALDKVFEVGLTHKYLFNELIDSIKSPNLDVTRLSFLIKLASDSGYKPNLEPDSNKKIRGFNLADANLVYEGDFRPVNLTGEDLINFLKLLRVPAKKQDSMSQESLEELSKFIKNYYEYHLNIELKNI